MKIAIGCDHGAYDLKETLKKYLADKGIETYWELLFEAKPATIQSLCSALEQGGEREMVKAFRYIMENYRENPEKIKDFVCGNMRYLRGRMLSYIKRNIELFY